MDREFYAHSRPDNPDRDTWQPLQDHLKSSGPDKPKQIFYAHTDPKNPHLLPEDGGRWQLLKDHLLRTAKQARKFALKVKKGDKTFAQTAYVAGLLHDLGKYRQEFQDYLKGQKDAGFDTHHAVYGAAACCCEANSSVTGFAIAGHHAGLHNAANLSQIIEGSKYAATTKYSMLLSLLCNDFGKIDYSKLIKDSGDDILRLEFITRMLFSILVDADRLNSEEWGQSIIQGIAWRRHTFAFHPETLLQRIIAARESKASIHQKDKLNKLRNTIFDECLKAGQKKQGFFSLTVPTGGGKTLSSMAFALAHATKHRLKRVIVVIPYLSIIEQNAKEYRDIFGVEQVLEHHCAVEVPEKKAIGDSEPAEASYLEKAMENWDMPIIITTSVQFIETLFSNKPGRVRKLHNIARSVVIFDEVQTMPIHLLNPPVKYHLLLIHNHLMNISNHSLVPERVFQVSHPAMARQPQPLSVYRSRMAFPCRTFGSGEH